MKQRSWAAYALAAIWIGNGLFCKVLGMVPRHEQIVARILGDTHAHLFTVAIGCAEMGMAVWVLSGWRYRRCAGTQIALIAVMNTLEFILAPDLLLWGRMNAFFAFLLIVFIYWTASGTRGQRNIAAHA
jgi:hypothetical protein